VNEPEGPGVVGVGAASTPEAMTKAIRAEENMAGKEWKEFILG